LAGAGCETVTRIGSWQAWLAGRRFHYDIVIGTRPDTVAALRRTQPQAVAIPTDGITLDQFLDQRTLEGLMIRAGIGPGAGD
jgi:hypothetical protein